MIFFFVFLELFRYMIVKPGALDKILKKITEIIDNASLKEFLYNS